MAGDGVQVLLAGNKLDLVKQDPKRREVDQKEAEKFAQEHQMLYRECSATADENIKEIFADLLRGKVAYSIKNP